MSDANSLFSKNKPCEEAIADLTRQLENVNFHIVRTFDLQDTRLPYTGQGSCPCPDHGLEDCGCQVVVLLIYSESKIPVSLMVHGHNDRTWFELVDRPDQRAEPQFQELVRRVLNGLV